LSDIIKTTLSFIITLTPLLLGGFSYKCRIFLPICNSITC